MTLHGLRGQQYQLDQKPFSSGGEGEIYRISGSNDRVVKVYKKGRAFEELEEKIKLMVKRPPSSSVLNQVAWPIDAVYDSTDSFCGFVMPKLDITVELGEVYVYPPRTGITYKQKLILAQNICAVIHEVHKTGYVFGDFNPRNIGINLNTGTVAFLDTDSYHIVIDKNSNKAYRCNVCAPGYAAPELLSKCSYHILAHPEDKQQAYAKTPLDTFTKETDNFALAIHIFKLLMNGFTPFNGIAENDSVSAASPGVGDVAVRRDNYCFKPGNKPQAVAVPPLNILSHDIQALFTRAFIDGRDKPEKRPSAIEWYKALFSFENSLVTCKRNPAHMFKKELKTCPWCEADDRYNASISPQLKQRTFSNPVTPPVVPTPIPAPVTPPANTSVGTRNISSAQLNTLGTPTSAIPAGAPSWRQKVNANVIKDVVGKWLNIIGWLAFVGSIVYVLLPLVSNGSLHLDETNIYGIDVVKDAIVAVIGVALVCFGTHFALSNSDILAFIISGIWSLIFCISAATVRYTQMGYNAISAEETWKFFGKLVLAFGIALVVGGKLGTTIRIGKQVSNNVAKSKHHYTGFEIFYIILMAVSSYACIPMLYNLWLFYRLLEMYNLVVIAMWAFPILVFLMFGYTDFGEVVKTWFCASMATYFTCLVLWLGHVGGADAIFMWLIFAIVGILFIIFMITELVESPILGLTITLFFVFFIVGAYVDLQVMNEGPGSVGYISHWLVSGPSILLILLATVSTLKEVIKK